MCDIWERAQVYEKTYGHYLNSKLDHNIQHIDVDVRIYPKSIIHVT